MSSYSIEVLGVETEDKCPCCGRATFEGEGVLNLDNHAVALYGYRYSEGHESRCTLAVCPLTETGEAAVGLAVVRGRSDGESLIYTVLDAHDSPWGDSAALGKVLSRSDIIDGNAIPNLFDLVDAIYVHESRIAGRVLAEIDG